MNTLALILQGLLALAFLASGVSKIAGVQFHRENFRRWRYPEWFMRVTGLVELTGAVGLAAGIFIPPITPFAALWLIATMLGAQYTHWIRTKDGQYAPSLVLLLLNLVVLVVNFSTLTATLV